MRLHEALGLRASVNTIIVTLFELVPGIVTI